MELTFEDLVAMAQELGWDNFLERLTVVNTQLWGQIEYNKEMDNLDKAEQLQVIYDAQEQTIDKLKTYRSENGL